MSLSIARSLQEKWNAICQEMIDLERTLAKKEDSEIQSDDRWSFAQNKSDADEKVFDALFVEWKNFMKQEVIPQVETSWDSSIGDHNGEKYESDVFQRPRESAFYRLRDGSVFGVIEENRENLSYAIITVGETLDERKRFDSITKICLHFVKALVLISFLLCAYAFMYFL